MTAISRLNANIVELQTQFFGEGQRVGLFEGVPRIGRFLRREAPQINMSLKRISERFSTLEITSTHAQKAKKRWEALVAMIDHLVKTEAPLNFVYLSEITKMVSSDLEKAGAINLRFIELEEFKSDCPNFDLTIVNDSYPRDQLTENQYTANEFMEIFDLYRQIQRGATNFKIQGSDAFKSLILADIKKILTRRTGVKFIKELMSMPGSVPILIEETKPGERSSANGTFLEPVFDEHFSTRLLHYRKGRYFHPEDLETPLDLILARVKIGREPSYLFETTSGGMRRSKVQFPWLTLVHELIHIHHLFEGGWLEVRDESKGEKRSLLYTDEEEEGTIVGNLKNGYQSKYSENLFRTLFKISPRAFHRCGVCPNMPPDLEIDRILQLDSIGDLISFFIKNPYLPIDYVSLLTQVISSQKKGLIYDFMIYLIDPDNHGITIELEAFLNRYYTETERTQIYSIKQQRRGFKNRAEMIKSLERMLFDNQLQELVNALELRGGHPVEGDVHYAQRLAIRLNDYRLLFKTYLLNPKALSTTSMLLAEAIKQNNCTKIIDFIAFCLDPLATNLPRYIAKKVTAEEAMILEKCKVKKQLTRAKIISMILQKNHDFTIQQIAKLIEAFSFSGDDCLEGHISDKKVIYDVILEAITKEDPATQELISSLLFSGHKFGVFFLKLLLEKGSIGMKTLDLFMQLDPDFLSNVCQEYLRIVGPSQAEETMEDISLLLALFGDKMDLSKKDAFGVTLFTYIQELISKLPKGHKIESINEDGSLVFIAPADFTEFKELMKRVYFPETIADTDDVSDYYV